MVEDEPAGGVIEHSRSRSRIPGGARRVRRVGCCALAIIQAGGDQVLAAAAIAQNVHRIIRAGPLNLREQSSNASRDLALQCRIQGDMEAHPVG